MILSRLVWEKFLYTSLSRTGQQTRKRALLECERRFGVNRTEDLNGSEVVKSPHELVYMGLDVLLCTCTHQVKEEASLVKNATCEAYVVCMGLDVRLCTCTHLVKQEASLVKNAICESYVKYGMNVFYKHTEKERSISTPRRNVFVRRRQTWCHSSRHRVAAARKSAQIRNDG